MLAMTDAYVQSKLMTPENRDRSCQYEVLTAPQPPELRKNRRSNDSFAARLDEFVCHDAGGLDAVVQQINNDIVAFDENKVFLYV